MADDQADPPKDEDPPWLTELARRAAQDPRTELGRYTNPVPADARSSAVLMLFGIPDGPSDAPDLLFLQRSGALRDHPSQVCFPGGSAHSQDRDAVATALRETSEETGLAADAVRVVGALRPLYLAWSGFSVVPVLGWWNGAAQLAVDDDEIVSVHRLPLADLADPAARLGVAFPAGYVGPGFLVRGLFVYGFTGSLVAWLLRLGGFERPWDTGRVEEVKAAERRYLS